MKRERWHCKFGSGWPQPAQILHETQCKPWVNTVRWMMPMFSDYSQTSFCLIFFFSSVRRPCSSASTSRNFKSDITKFANHLAGEVLLFQIRKALGLFISAVLSTVTSQEESVWRARNWAVQKHARVHFHSIPSEQVSLLISFLRFLGLHIFIVLENQFALPIAIKCEKSSY